MVFDKIGFAGNDVMANFPHEDLELRWYVHTPNLVPKGALARAASLATHVVLSLLRVEGAPPTRFN